MKYAYNLIDVDAYKYHQGWQSSFWIRVAPMCRGAPWGNRPTDNFKTLKLRNATFIIYVFMFSLKLGELKPPICPSALPSLILLGQSSCPRNWQRNQTSNTVYNQCVVPLMMYGSKTWALYRQIERSIQQWELRSLLKIKWHDFIINERQCTIWLIQQESASYITNPVYVTLMKVRLWARWFQVDKSWASEKLEPIGYVWEKMCSVPQPEDKKKLLLSRSTSKPAPHLRTLQGQDFQQPKLQIL